MLSKWQLYENATPSELFDFSHELMNNSQNACTTQITQKVSYLGQISTGKQYMETNQVTIHSTQQSQSQVTTSVLPP
jgi:hypothetical protein